MYKTKYKITAKADLGLLSIHTGGAKGKGDPYQKPKSQSLAEDRFKGKQFALPKKTSGQYFSRFPFAVKGKNDPYHEKNSKFHVAQKRVTFDVQATCDLRGGMDSELAIL